MRMKFISGLMALHLATAMTASAQTYNFSIGNDDSYVRIADHIGGEYLGNLYNESTLESYNLLHNNKNFVGLLRFDGGAGGLFYARHYWLPSEEDHLRALKGYQIDSKSAYVVTEKVDVSGTVKSAVLLRYNKDDGEIVSSVELATLPPGYSFIRVFDVMENFAEAKPKRILCTVKRDGVPVIVELLYDGSSQYVVREYKMENPPKEFKSVHYVRAYHYGSVSLGKPSFYGLADDGSSTTAFCYFENPNNGTQIYERYALASAGGKKGISGVQMAGSYGPNGNHFRIEMAFTDMEGAICIQQKDELMTTNWERNYRFPEKEKFYLGWGRDGHGTKQGPGGEKKAFGYFLGAWVPNDDITKSQVATLLFDGNTGGIKRPRLYNFSGQGIFKDGSFPSTSYDHGEYVSGQYVQDYTFTADRFEKRNGFQYGTGNTLDNGAPEFFCAKEHSIIDTREKRLSTITEHVYVYDVEKYDVNEIQLEEYPDIKVEFVMECPPEKGAGQKSSLNKVIENNSSELSMDNQHIRIGATGQAITGVHIFSIDGRSIAETQGVNAANYEHQFAKPLVPGIYVIHIIYSDHSKEVRKVSIR